MLHTNGRTQFFSTPAWKSSGGYGQVAIVSHTRQWNPCGMLVAHGTPHWHWWLCQSFHAHTELAWHAMHLMARLGPGIWSCNISLVHMQNQMVQHSWSLSLAACGGPGTSCMEPTDKKVQSSTHGMNHNASISPGSWSWQLASSCGSPGKIHDARSYDE